MQTKPSTQQTVIKFVGIQMVCLTPADQHCSKKRAERAGRGDIALLSLFPPVDCRRTFLHEIRFLGLLPAPKGDVPRGPMYIAISAQTGRSESVLFGIDSMSLK